MWIVALTNVFAQSAHQKRGTVKDLEQGLACLAHESAVCVSVVQTRGSVPREAGTHMLVFEHFSAGTIGGGHLEFAAIERARQLLHSGQLPTQPERHVLGPSLGQCCGGVVDLAYAQVQAADEPALRAQWRSSRVPLALFGGGHVGRALVRALAPLPFDVHWIDSRDEVFPGDVPAQVVCEHSNPVQAAVQDLAPQSRVLIMSFSHAEDLDIVMACLRRLREQDDLPFVGLIGSKTKWASFSHRLLERGFSQAEIDRITCPIGLPGIQGKEPEVIAASVAAQLLQTLG